MALDWWEINDNVVLLTRYMADHGYDAHAVAYAVDKPWKFKDEYQEARKELAHDRNR
jgi:hypothetical protein